MKHIQQHITTITSNMLVSLPVAIGFLSIRPPDSSAAMANLADVGIKEFLVKDGRQFLRLSIPLADHQKFAATKSSGALRVAQENLELPKLRFEQVGFTNPSAWTNSLKDVNSALTTIKAEALFLTSSTNYPNGNDPKLETTQTNLISTIQELLSALRNKDIDLARDKEEQAAELLAQLRLNQVPAHELPFTIPNEYDTLPRLKGRATIRMILEKQKGFRLPDGNSYVSTIPLEMIVDGYHAPITAGNFVDLVQRHFYDNMILNNVEQLTITTGKASSSSQASPQKTPRTIPLELFYKKDTEPVYGITSDDDLRATDALTLPFQAYGALGMGRENNDPDSGSTEFFFLKWLQALIPPGRNTLDGYYSCFGYIVKNEDFLKQIEVGDRIVTAQVIQGLENLELSAEN